ncbi:MAG: Gfo/Idh/MocA family oxidoreductase [Bacilli bacterium]|nr:Gfo/Idh/MocA family oxidoreductase [Bacilli bacterium]
MKKICIIGAGHAFKFQYQALKDLGYDILVCDINQEKIKDYPNGVTDYRKIPDDYKLVLISTPPNTHYEIIKYLAKQNKQIICEKPLVISLKELYELEENNYQFYNILHFSFGDEIEWFINSKYKNEKPLHIKVHINDPYIENNHIKEEQICLNGSYLDETINPLSALKRIYKKDIFYRKVTKFMYEDDKYDYASISKFQMENIEIDALVKWNDKNDRSKYIDLYFEDYTIRLDSINRSVINLTTNEILYKNEEERMYKHYINAIKDFEKVQNNEKESLKLNKEILRGA